VPSGVQHGDMASQIKRIAQGPDGYVDTCLFNTYGQRQECCFVNVFSTTSSATFACGIFRCRAGAHL